MQNLLSISATAGYYIRTFTPKKKKNKKNNARDIYLVLVKREQINCGIMNPLERMVGKKMCKYS